MDETNDKQSMIEKATANTSGHCKCLDLIFSTPDRHGGSPKLDRKWYSEKLLIGADKTELLFELFSEILRPNSFLWEKLSEELLLLTRWLILS